ncbi:type I toxin-antitoxin system Hok family toxin [Providencia stuartii]|uniref:Type I toxin-antitoxin system Hok family toxin n=2 Tax=Providencia TaxID=586 RepID=A0AAI9GHD8_PROST|nr:type I toxin-antitoxin system Hok family toxin [Providencia stuartii]ELR5112090.1 type I toxin-antitoxin system Hok family toxin [Providencia stuartii]ELR5302526.1 type I toxin-antitoxin system Hok family toxin [Providencia stuartii]QQO63522.1 type I toxin-antitoxin system Hok family toxin [Providencia manganoxydans]HEF8773952.1 type I toxin-antitoxin system Hok family toxin [Providencia stuartii]
MTKYMLISLVAICITVFGISLLIHDRLCSINFVSGNTTVKATLFYEIR